MITHHKRQLLYALCFHQNDEAVGGDTDLDTAVCRGEVGAEIPNIVPAIDCGVAVKEFALLAVR